MSWALTALSLGLGAAPVCEDLAAWSPEQLKSHLPEVEASLGLGAITDEGTEEERAERAGPRIAAACELARRPPLVRSPPDPALLTRVLDREEFSAARERTSPAFRKFLDTLLDWILRLGGSSGAETYSRGARFLVLAVAFGVVAFAASRLLSRRGKARRRSMRASGGAQSGLVLEPSPVHLARSRELLAGDARGALREALLALLSALERRRWARPDRVKTNRELSAELLPRGAPDEVARTASELLSWYDATFYSLREVGRDEAGAFIERVERFQARLTEAPV